MYAPFKFGSEHNFLVIIVIAYAPIWIMVWKINFKLLRNRILHHIYFARKSLTGRSSNICRHCSVLFPEWEGRQQRWISQCWDKTQSASSFRGCWWWCIRLLSCWNECRVRGLCLVKSWPVSSGRSQLTNHASHGWSLCNRELVLPYPNVVCISLLVAELLSMEWTGPSCTSWPRNLETEGKSCIVKKTSFYLGVRYVWSFWRFKTVSCLNISKQLRVSF